MYYIIIVAFSSSSALVKPIIISLYRICLSAKDCNAGGIEEAGEDDGSCFWSPPREGDWSKSPNWQPSRYNLDNCYGHHPELFFYFCLFALISSDIVSKTPAFWTVTDLNVFVVQVPQAQTSIWTCLVEKPFVPGEPRLEGINMAPDNSRFNKILDAWLLHSTYNPQRAVYCVKTISMALYVSYTTAFITGFFFSQHFNSSRFFPCEIAFKQNLREKKFAVVGWHQCVTGRDAFSTIGWCISRGQPDNLPNEAGICLCCLCCGEFKKVISDCILFVIKST